MINNHFVDQSFLVCHGIFEASTIIPKQTESIYYAVSTRPIKNEVQEETLSSGKVKKISKVNKIPKVKNPISKKRKKPVSKKSNGSKKTAGNSQIITRKKPNKWTNVRTIKILTYIFISY